MRGGEQQRQQRDAGGGNHGVMTVASPLAHINGNKRHSDDTSAVFPLYEPLPPVSVSFSTSDTALQVRVYARHVGSRKPHPAWQEKSYSC